VHAGRQPADGKLWRIRAIHQHEPVAAECAGPALHQIRREAALTIVRRREMSVGDRRDAGELPFLIARSRKAGVREVLDPLPAQIPQP
jgi:hypothetical protein